MREGPHSQLQKLALHTRSLRALTNGKQVRWQQKQDGRKRNQRKPLLVRPTWPKTGTCKQKMQKLPLRRLFRAIWVWTLWGRFCSVGSIYPVFISSSNTDSVSLLTQCDPAQLPQRNQQQNRIRDSSTRSQQVTKHCSIPAHCKLTQRVFGVFCKVFSPEEISFCTEAFGNLFGDMALTL